MLKIEAIGHLGAAAEVQSYEGGKFVKFRIAHTETWKNERGERQSQTMWVDAVMNCPDGQVPAVVPYLVAGSQVFLRGDVRLRVYSSQKDRCMKAGLTINVRDIELLGGKADPVPRQLIRQEDGTLVDIQKWFLAPGKWPKQGAKLVDKHGAIYNVDKNGWISISTAQADSGDTKE